MASRVFSGQGLRAAKGLHQAIQSAVHFKSFQYTIQINSIQALQTKGSLVNKKWSWSLVAKSCYVSESQGLWAFRATPPSVSVATKAAWMILGGDNSILEKKTANWIKQDSEAGLWTGVAWPGQQWLQDDSRSKRSSVPSNGTSSGIVFSSRMSCHVLRCFGSLTFQLRPVLWYNVQTKSIQGTREAYLLAHQNNWLIWLGFARPSCPFDDRKRGCRVNCS